MQESDFFNDKNVSLYLILDICLVLPLAPVFSLIMGLLCVTST